PISRIRAPAARMSSINFSCRTRSSTTTTKSSTSRSSRFAIDFRLSATGTSRSIAPLQAGPTTLFSIYKSHARSNPHPALAVIKSHRRCRRDRGILDHAQKIQAELFFHYFFSALPVPGFTVLHGLPLTLQGGAYHRPKGLAPSISLAGHAALQVLERYHLRFLDPPL